MFRKELIAKFQRIFDMEKCTFDSPGEDPEQEKIFIAIEDAKVDVKDGRVVGRARGKLVIYALNTKLPFGYMLKQIKKGAADDTKDLFFTDLEENSNGYRNLVQRGASFVYFFNSQYDPETGSITSMSQETAVT